jgi:uridine monophosphate synthetase
MDFWDKLDAQVRRSNSLLCVGLDPDLGRFPASLLEQSNPILAFNRRTIDATKDLVCAYKPNFAFYEAAGLAGLQALKQTIEYIPDSIPVILDAKRGDIGSTAEAYAQAAFDVWGADAVTVNPYLGYDSLKPFLDHADKGVFLLCHTSNEGARDFQDLSFGGRPLHEIVAAKALEWGTALVVGATYPQALHRIRQLAPDAWILVPGVGAQGGDLEEALAAGLDSRGTGLIINASRSIIYASDPQLAAQQLRERINQARGLLARSLRTSPRLSTREELCLALYDLGCVRFGDFTLVSGQRSPIYLDLRLLVSSPAALKKAAQAYVDILGSLSFDRLAGIPYAALPIATAVALQMEIPLIYPRKELKEYGTRRGIEGHFEPGERAVVLDDLITTGGSKLRAIEPLEKAGLAVKDVVVLVDRGQGGAEELAERGYALHAVLTLQDMLDILAEHGRISSEQRDDVLAFLKGAPANG